VACLDELVVTAQRETGATFFIITHNIQSVMRTADYMGILFRSSLVKFASKPEWLACDKPIIQQFLAGRPEGPIGMDEMADSDGRTHRDGDARHWPSGRLPALAAHAPSDQPVPPKAELETPPAPVDPGTGGVLTSL
jgi:phospholipid/cholesterol/gamma-HCH transport system ATP-binding protein